MKGDFHEHDLHNPYCENLHRLSQSFHHPQGSIQNDLYVLHFAMLRFDKVKVLKMAMMQHLMEDKKVSFHVLDKVPSNEKNQGHIHEVEDSPLKAAYCSSCWPVSGSYF